MTSLEQVQEWKQQGVIHVSASQAAKVLHCSPSGIYKSAKEGQLGLAFFFSGQHLHISVQGILNFLEGRNFPEAQHWYIGPAPGMEGKHIKSESTLWAETHQEEIRQLSKIYDKMYGKR